MGFKCFAMRKVTMPWAKGRINEEANAVLDECAALECACPGSLECPFYKTKAKLEEGQQKAFERISRLPRTRQLDIAEKYYDGKMPWNEMPEGL